MTTLITENFKVELAKRLYDSLDLGLNSSLPTDRQTYFYAILGRQAPWPDEENPPTPTEGTNCLNVLYKNALFAKRLSNAQASFVARRIDWTTGTVYDAYSDITCNFSFDLDFYVMNSTFKVFKCLDNNDGAESTSEPDITLSTTSLEEPYIETADGYKWKYLYTLSSIQRQKYLTEEWIPVSTNKFVSAAAVGGSIDIVKITNSGNNYVDGSAQDIISLTGDGTAAQLRANVVDGQIVDVIIQNRGSNYTYTDITVTDVAGGSGTSASLQAIVSPPDGHGFDPVYELGASKLMFDCDFETTDTEFITENDYRQVFVVLNPQAQSTGTLATSEKYTCYFRIKTSSGVGDFNEDEVIYQGTTFEESTFTANVVYFDATQNYLYVNNIRGTALVNQSVKGFSTGSIRIVNSFELPSLKLYSGKVLYISNTLAVSRNTDQTDRVRFILNFDN
jgi:hypothetical protein